MSTIPESRKRHFFPTLDETSPEEIKRIRQRQKNNEAVKICREKRKRQEKETFEAVIKLKALNEKMETEYQRTEQETELLKVVLPFCKHSIARSKKSSSSPESEIENNGKFPITRVTVN